MKEKQTCWMIHILLGWSAISLNSCTWIESNKPPEIQDLRVKHIQCCPVHGDTLVEALAKVDLERGQYLFSYYRIREKLFPAAFDDPDGRGVLALVTYCPKCRVAKKHYLRDGIEFHKTDMLSDDPEVSSRKLDEFIHQQRCKLDTYYSETPHSDSGNSHDPAASN